MIAATEPSFVRLPDGTLARISLVEAVEAGFATLREWALEQRVLGWSGLVPALNFLAAGREEHLVLADRQLLRELEAEGVRIPASWVERLEVLEREMEEPPSEILGLPVLLGVGEADAADDAIKWRRAGEPLTAPLMPAAAAPARLRLPQAVRRGTRSRARRSASSSAHGPPGRPSGGDDDPHPPPPLARALARALRRWWRP